MPVSRTVNLDILSFFRRVENKSTLYINQLIVSGFVAFHGLNVRERNLLYKYLLPHNEKNLKEFIKLVKKTSLFDTEALVEIFEYVISPADKEVNGAIYTPAFIREFIISKILSRYDKTKWTSMLYADLSCGCGGFFYTLIRQVREAIPETSIAWLTRECIVGVDIKEFSIERTMLLLALYALQKGEELTEDDFNLYCQNSLSNDFTFVPIVVRHGGIDVVVSNPPYVASSKLSEENKQYARNWEVSRTGKADLYLPFFQLGIDSLRPGGMLGYITVNTFYRSLNGCAFRDYLAKNGYDTTIIDFGSEQLFRGCSTYTCVCLIEKRNSGGIHYIETESGKLSEIDDASFETVTYDSLDNRKGWVLKDSHTAERIKAIESVGKPLGDIVSIRNGFATLRNDIYIVKPKRETVRYLFVEKNDRFYRIEKGICRKAVKANLIRREEDIEKFSDYIIFPYSEREGRKEIIGETFFRNRYPGAYEYLNDCREELAKRDKGHKKYPAWFAFGRSQALNLEGERLLFPHICDGPCYVYCQDQELLFYDGYAIFAESHDDLEVIRRILMSDVFWYYITKTSKPYSGGFFSLEKRYIKHFGIPKLSDEQKEILLGFESQYEVNQWLRRFY